MAVVNRATAERFFPGTSALGKSIEANGQQFRIIGVGRLHPFADVWVPLTTTRGVPIAPAPSGVAGPAGLQPAGVGHGNALRGNRREDARRRRRGREPP
ncbi:MAG: ABC transporter permease [Vicinamibacterales bacterium]